MIPSHATGLLGTSRLVGRLACQRPEVSAQPELSGDAEYTYPLLLILQLMEGRMTDSETALKAARIFAEKYVCRPLPSDLCSCVDWITGDVALGTCTVGKARTTDSFQKDKKQAAWFKTTVAQSFLCFQHQPLFICWFLPLPPLWPGVSWHCSGLRSGYLCLGLTTLGTPDPN